LASENNFQRAITWFQKAREHGTGDVELLNSLGNCLIQTEDFAGAEEVYESSLQRDPNQASVKKILQDLQSVQGRQRPGPLPG
jgi:Flp pilus assembly protein TadD